jgi:hypothetical protein
MIEMHEYRDTAWAEGTALNDTRGKIVSSINQSVAYWNLPMVSQPTRLLSILHTLISDDVHAELTAISDTSS